MKIVPISIAIFLIFLGSVNAITIQPSITCNSMANKCNLGFANLPTDTALGYNQSVTFVFSNIVLNNVIFANTVNSVISATVGSSMTATITSPLISQHRVVSIVNGQNAINVNNVTIIPPNSVSIDHTFQASNTIQVFTTTPIPNVSISDTASAYIQPILNINQSVSCTGSSKILLNNPLMNALIIERPCPKWNYNPIYDPSYNAPLLVINSTINFSITVNQIATPLILGNLSKNPLGTLNSLNVSKSTINIGWYDKLRNIYIGYPDYKVNRTFIPGQSATWPYVNISVHELNWSNLATNWNSILNSYEKYIIPLCDKNATWKEGNITYCAKLKGKNQTDIRLLCQEQDIIDHNITQVLPNCVTNAINNITTRANAQYLNQQPYVSTYIHPDSYILNQTSKIKFYENNGWLIVIFIITFTAIVLIGLALNSAGRMGLRIGRKS